MSESELSLPRRFLRACRRAGGRRKVADSSGAELSGADLLLRTLIFRRLLGRTLDADENYVGLLLPPSIGAVLANAALPLLGKIAVNLNYTLAEKTLNRCIEKCGIKRVLTSRRFLEKMPLKFNAETIFLEDFKERVTTTDKLVAAFQAKLLPLGMLESHLGLTKHSPNDTLTVIFTSGSTGDPKGVVLSHDNVRANIASIEECVRLTSTDTLIGALPFFHSYGYTATMWTALALDVAGVYHFSPLEAQQIGKLCEKYGVTVLMSTPTFLRNYLRKCTPEQFKKIDVVFGSAEKLPKDLCDAFEEKFGHRPLEAYGATEMSPLISVNVPASRNPQGDNSAAREGTVGRPIPGVTAKVVHPETGVELPAGEAGMLWVTGKNVMRGYLNEPELTAKAIREGWYVTGDIAFLHPDGFIQITGRQSRFSKIGGEMVPHLKIEEHLLQALQAGEDELPLVVTAVPDAKRGERIVVLHRPLSKPVDELRKALTTDGLPNIWIPSTDSFKEVATIPVLGTGKLDLKGVKDLAKALFVEEIE